jgi:nucleotide-binding universal stress UspA family protein
MIKNILLALPSSKSNAAALNYAASMAQLFDAHLTGAAVTRDIIMPGTVFDSAGAEVMEAYHRESQAAAKAAIASFDEKSRREALSTGSLLLDARAVGAGELLARTARRFDFTIMQQASPDSPEDDDLLIEAALVGSGRPVLIVPYIHDKPLKLDRIMICWDGGRNAARALNDALPFLERAKQIEVVTISSSSKATGTIPGADIGHHLSRHGVNVEVRNLAADNIGISNRILSHAADHSIDLIVMGGYGHSRLREFVLGGTTREILQSMTVPTLMSH